MFCHLIKSYGIEFCVSFLFLPFHEYVVLDLLINVQQPKVFFVVRTEKCIKYISVYPCSKIGEHNIVVSRFPRIRSSL